MQELINLATQQLGMSSEQGQAVTGGALALIKDGLDGDRFSQLLEKLPGAAAMLDQHESASSSGIGGLLGGLSSAFGGSNAATIAGLVAQLATKGIDAETVMKFLPLIAEHIGKQTGFDVSSLLGQGPGGSDSPLAGLARGLFS